MSEEKMNRRGFLKASTVLGVGSVVGASALLSACKDGNGLAIKQRSAMRSCLRARVWT